TLITVAVASLVATSVYALTGLVLAEPGVSVAEALEVLPVALLYDVAITPLVVPLAMLIMRTLDPTPVRW
ncbi:MAG: hypothetical protein M3386_09195, partial [Actinomycetota bacterium]|nr:hypothetical protein [Actinomycetota bacterium]